MLTISFVNLLEAGAIDVEEHSVEADLTQAGNQVSRPAVDVLFLDQLAQALHVGGSLIRVHFQGITDGTGSSFNIVYGFTSTAPKKDMVGTWGLEPQTSTVSR